MLVVVAAAQDGPASGAAYRHFAIVGTGDVRAMT